MTNQFKKYLKCMETKKNELTESVPSTIEGGLPKEMPRAGLYLFSQGKDYLYVGRSDHIRQRLGFHSRPSSGHNKACFAFRMAKKKLGIGKATYRKDTSRKNLLSDQAFATEFERAKARIRKMPVRFVQEEDPIMQALLEIYVAVELNTKYNSFKTT